MRRNTFIKRALIAVMFLLSIISYSQNYVPFTTPRYDQDIRGDMFLIGNNILNRDTNNTNPNDPYSGTGTNNSDFDMNYIDIDSDASTFCSSSAQLVSPRPGGDNCYKIRYAGLYWAADLQSGSRTNINKVKFKLPTGGYIDITGTVVYDANPTPIGGDGMKPYACYADVTSLIAPLANPVGNYTVANVVASQGTAGGTGLAAGWTLFLVYEDPTLTSKSIVSFDGFSGIGGATTLTFPVTGFRTIPVGPVRAKFAMSALEGDRVLSGDYLRINGTTITTPERPGNNFFNATINTPAGPFTTRNPNSSNTLGYDASVLNVNNPGNAVIGNNVTSANIELGSTGDVYFYFFNAFAVDIIAPEIQLTKDVENSLGTPIGGANVNLGQQLNYVIGFQNIGNDNATSFIIKDILPLNVIFNPADLALPGALPPGVTFTYNSTTREIIFTVPSILVEVGDPRFEINIRVHVVSTCMEMDDACSNLIQNQAFATYSGTFNTTVFSDEGSIASFGACGFGTPGSTNFLVGLDDCNFTRTEIKCGTTPLVLTAANGYQSYVWSGPGTITPVAGTNNQSVTVTSVGTYTVNDIINTSPCKSIVETINVVDFSASVTNPAIPVADQIVLCPTDGQQLPYIFLCSAGETQAIPTNIANATSITWQSLNVGSCAAVADTRCANTNPACTWTTLSTAPNFTVNAAGQYRVIIIFQGGCQRTFYFNVYQNLISPTVATRDIICTNPGQITINGVPPGYEYLLTPPGTTWQTSNIFPINTAGVYNVDIRQIGVTGGCVIPLSNIAIQARSMTVTATVTQPSCFPQKGSINLIANGVNPQYTYNIYQEPGHTLVNSVGPIAANNYLFSNLNSGNYSYQVTTPDGCLATGTFTINTLQPLSVTAALTIPLTCNDGEITIYPVGGTPPYSYFINSATVFQASPQYVVTAPGTYNIQVVDFNNCSATTSINVVRILPPAFNITKTDIACSSSGNTGTITVNVSNPNGNTLMYSINGAAGPFSASPVFTNLPAGSYSVVVQYTAGTSQPCTTAPQPITIVAPTPIVGTATLTQTYDCTHPGIITVSGVSGGTGPYMYSIDGVTFQVGNTFTITSAGTYTISIRDANGCIITRGPIVVDALDGPRAVSITIHDVITCPSGTGTLNVNLIAGGLAPIRFRIVSPAAYATAYTSSGLFAGLPGGNTYCFEVIDRNGCTYQECYFFPPLPPFTVTGQVLNNVRCIGTSTGNGQFTVSGIPNSTNYSYQINSAPPAGINGTTPATGSSTFVINLTNVPAGSYTLTIHNDANNCDATQTIVITQPATALTANLTPSPLTCNGPATGQVVVNASGGWGGYTYTLTPPSGPVVGPQASNIFANLSLPGLYTVTTLDSGGCSVTSTFTLTGPVAPTAIISAASDFCYDGTNGATIVVTASGGVPPYTYTNNGGASQSSNTFGPLVPGTYNIVVTDSFGCTVALPTQTINPQLSIGATLFKDLDCNSPSNAIIAVNITGGYPGYQYQVNINGAGYGALISTGTPFNYPAASAGTYQFQVTDIRGCTAQSNVITINPLVPISATNAVTNVTCNGLSNGSVTITPSGGVAPYQINFNGAGFNTATTYSNLPAGTYNYIVRDTKNCTFNGSVTISQPAPIVGTATLTTQFTCTTSGVITVSGVSGGTSPYTYSMNGGPFGPATTFTITAAGTYTITIRDANGCTLVLAPIVVAPLSPPTDLSFVATALTCPANTSNVTITVTGTNSPYIYEAIAPGPILAPQASNVFNNLPPGTYTFQVTDTKNCKYQENFTINPLPVLTVTGSVVSNVKCFGTSSGSIRFNVSGFSPNYSYVITGPPNSSAVAQTAPVINVINLPAGTYTIVVTNPTTNCTATASVTVTQPATALVAPVTIAPIRCGSLGQVTVNASGGWGGYTYVMVPMPAGVTLSGSTFSNIPAGNYSINTIDSGGCQAPTPFTLTNPSPPTATISAASDFCYDPVNSATIVVTAAGGVP
uniref:beta strand repeat-containing protein n=1 Tax=Flavobacterium sp. TaxID=239 RepID=UPI00263954EE